VQAARRVQAARLGPFTWQTVFRTLPSANKNAELGVPSSTVVNRNAGVGTLFGNRHHISMTSLTRDPVWRSALHASTLAVFLLGMIGQGFSPCPHHASLDPSGHSHPGVSGEAIHGGLPNGDVTRTDSDSDLDEALCSCLNACDAESGDSFAPAQSYAQPLAFPALNVVERLATNLLDTRQNAYLVPLPQPPPHSS
jgi:hypothetical protein